MDWSVVREIALYAPTVVLFSLVCYVAVKALPLWRDLRIAELEARDREAKMQSQQIELLRSVTETLHDVVSIYNYQAQIGSISQRALGDRVNRIEEMLQQALQQTADELTHNRRKTMPMAEKV